MIINGIVLGMGLVGTAPTKLVVTTGTKVRVDATYQLAGVDSAGNVVLLQLTSTGGLVG